MLRFHWRLPTGGERAPASRAQLTSAPESGLPDLAAQVPFSQAAEALGIDSLLIDFGWSKPDPILLATALGLATSKVRFIIAHRSGLMGPVTFVQQLNTLSALIGDRFSLNIVAGHSPDEQRGYGDFLSHDDRYARTDEYLHVCRYALPPLIRWNSKTGGRLTDTRSHAMFGLSRAFLKFLAQTCLG